MNATPTQSHPLDAADGSDPVDPYGSPTPDEPTLMGEIPVECIDPDTSQPRTEHDQAALERLAGSLTAHGQLQPIVVRPGKEPGRFTIVSGERRWRAAVLAGRPTLIALIRQDPTDGTRVLELQLTENAQREDLTPLDQARAFRALMDHHRWTTRDLAGFLHLHHSTVSRAVRLLDLPESVRAYVLAGTLAPSVAAEIARLPDEDAQRYLAEQVITKGMTRLEVVEAVHQFTGKPRGSSRLVPDRRVFTTSNGRVTIELDHGAGFDGLVIAVTEVVNVLKAENLSRQTADERYRDAEPGHGEGESNVNSLYPT